MLKSEDLRRFELLRSLNTEQLLEVARHLRMQRLAKGAMLFKRGRELTEHFLLLEGEVDLINNEFGVEKVLAEEDSSRIALNRHDPTRVSAVAKSPVTYLTLNKALLAQIVTVPVTKGPAASDGIDESAADTTMLVGDLTGDDWMSCLLQSPLFARIPWNQLQELFGKFETLEVSQGDKIVKEGGKGDYFYVVAKGAALVTNRSGSVDVELRQGQYFGEEALISRAPRNATVTMTCDGLVKRLSADDFCALVQQPVIQYWSSEQLEALRRPYKLLDVRMPLEYRLDAMDGSANVPLSRLRDSLQDLGQGTVYVISDQAGARAEIAAYLLCQAGFDAVVLKNAVQAQAVSSCG